MAAGFECIQLQLRRIIRDLVPVEVDTRGLAAALCSLAERTAVDYDIECHFEGEDAVGLPDNLMATHFYRIAQEAVTNAVKHASASHIDIQLRNVGDGLALSIIDNGVGIAAPAHRGEGLGLGSMAYRAELLGGMLRIKPSEEGGTAVRCKVLRSPGRTN